MSPHRARGRFAPYVLGTALLALAAVLAAFAVGAAAASEDPWGFAMAAAIGLGIGLPLRWVGRTGSEPTRREALAAVLSLWLLFPVVGHVPYVVSAGMTPLNALFEAMSGFTATGATAIADFDAVPSSLFLFRAFSQWVGGIGILVLFIAVFPQLAIAGRQIFHTEMPGPTEQRLTPRLRHTAGIVLSVYLALSLVCGIAYVMAGMPLFDAVAHAFTTVAAAGFSPQARSFESYHPAVDWVAVVFMTLAAVNFALLWRAFGGRPRELLRDPELRAYLVIVVLVGTLVTIQIAPLYVPGEAVRHGFFQVVSIMTTTGYASVDYDTWPDAARALLVALMFIGGSAGSAAGGVKVARWLIMAQHTAREVRRALHPRAVLPLRVGDRRVGEEVVRAVAAFIALYTVLLGVSAMTVAWLGEDLTTAFTAAAATIGNVGPGLGLVGPMASYAELHPVSRGLLIFNMYAGRLEIVTVFVLATPGWWRLPRGWRRGIGARRRPWGVAVADATGTVGAVLAPRPSGPSGRGRTAPFVIGSVLGAVGLLLTVFGAVALLLGEPAAGYALGAVVGVGSGLALRAWGRPGSPASRHGEPTRREALVALLASWVLVPAIGALPFVGAGVLGPLDAYFESMSGFTTTGATTITDFSAVGPVLFMWRAFTQWIGGIGIIVLFVGLFPQLAIAGRQLFFAEAPGPTEERLTPRLRHTAFALLAVYGALTAACILAYDLAGMRTYDAVAHAFTTMAAGGFSPHARSFEGLAPALMWVAVVFMLFAGSNFALLYRGFAGRSWAILRDIELRSYLGVAAAVSVAVALVLAADGFAFAEAWRHAAFQTVSILTSTGYASIDFGTWSERSQALLLLVAFIGGSAGSAAGGVKVVRWVILVQHTSREVRRTMHPRAVLPVRIGGRVVPEDVQRSVAAFITLYLSLFALTTVALVLLGEDFVTAFSATIACLGNIGPGLASVGPMASFAELHPLAKGLLIFAMYAGRLEVVTVFALLTRAWWRRPRYDRGFRG